MTSFWLAAMAGECDDHLASRAASPENIREGEKLDGQRLFNIWLQTTVADGFKKKKKTNHHHIFLSFSAETAAYFL